jgi:hypothetical protein
MRAREGLQSRIVPLTSVSTKLSAAESKSDRSYAGLTTLFFATPRRNDVLRLILALNARLGFFMKPPEKFLHRRSRTTSRMQGQGAEATILMVKRKSCHTNAMWPRVFGKVNFVEPAIRHAKLEQHRFE